MLVACCIRVGVRVVSLLAIATLVDDPRAQAAGESDAERAVHEAEKLVERGAYVTGVTAYRAIEERYPGTESAAIARERAAPNGLLGWADLVRHGPSSNRVDVVIMGDGYTLDQQDSFADFAKSVPKVFKNHKLLGEYFEYHNFIRAHVVSREAGIDGFGREADTALGAAVADTVLGHVTVSTQRVHHFLDLLPAHDGYAVVFVKRGSHGTGGGGVATIGGRDDDTMVHEWGHAFGGLGDEYDVYTGVRGSSAGWPNVSASDDPKRVPWRHFLDAGVPGVGVYRGGNGQLDGAWKPTNHCAMNSGVIFCPVCREQMLLHIYELVDPIDGCAPSVDAEIALRAGTHDSVEVAVDILLPKTHGLEVCWWVLRADEVPRPPPRGRQNDRRARGPLPALPKAPAQCVANSRAPNHRFRFTPGIEAKGRFRVVCRVRDAALPSGQQTPWVLRDPDGLLESERGWWVDVGP